MVEKAKKIWLDGNFVDWDDANVHILTHSLHYGLGIFEGIRCYECEDGRSAVFRLPEHVERFFDSAHSMLMKIPFSQDEISQAILDTLRANEQKSAYIRPLAFIGDGAMGLHPQDNPIRVSIITWVWGAYLGEEGLTKGIRAKVSSYSRHHPNILMTKTKTCGNYVNSTLAKLEVTKDGYDEAIMLDPEGLVGEGTGENIFIARKGVLKTPPLTSILPGITRDCVITIARDLGFAVHEARISRDELYVADEAFFTGTAAEITPIREVDQRSIGGGLPGPLTRKLQDTFFEVVKGAQQEYSHWLTYV
jgi:branched-chain amino acid aminotransferase